MAKPASYDLVSRVNHWVIALAVIGMLGFGLYLEFGTIDRDARGLLVGIHRSIGVLVLVFGLWRVLWRLFQGFPAPVSRMPSWQETASKVAHWALLAGVLIMPLSGIAFTVFRGRPVDVFGWFSIPAQTEIPWLASVASTTHGLVGKALVVLVALHIVAALKHHIVDRDATLSRMLHKRVSTDAA